MINIAIFASGNGSNAEAMIRHFQEHPRIRVGLVMTNKSDAGVIQRAQSLDTPVYVFSREEFKSEESIVPVLMEYNIDFIVLAGFLWLIPPVLVQHFPGRIVNIHPALLPKYGGKGMYGMHVHQAVIAAGDQESGITIHFVNEKYDEGQIIFQATCTVEHGDTPELLAAKIHQLEHAHYPQVVEGLVLKLE